MSLERLRKNVSSILMVSLILIGLLSGFSFIFAGTLTADGIQQNEYAQLFYTDSTIEEYGAEFEYVGSDSVESLTYTSEDVVDVNNITDNESEFYWGSLKEENVKLDNFSNDGIENGDSVVFISDETVHYYEFNGDGYRFTPIGHIWWLTLFFGGILLVAGSVNATLSLTQK